MFNYRDSVDSFVLLKHFILKCFKNSIFDSKMLLLICEERTKCILTTYILEKYSYSHFNTPQVYSKSLKQ